MASQHSSAYSPDGMAQYPDTTAATLRTLEQATVLTYLFRLTHQLSSCYDVVLVFGAPGCDVAGSAVRGRAAGVGKWLEGAGVAAG